MTRYVFTCGITFSLPLVQKLQAISVLSMVIIGQTLVCTICMFKCQPSMWCFLSISNQSVLYALKSKTVSATCLPCVKTNDCLVFWWMCFPILVLDDYILVLLAQYISQPFFFWPNSCISFVLTFILFSPHFFFYFVLHHLLPSPLLLIFVSSLCVMFFLFLNVF